MYILPTMELNHVLQYFNQRAADGSYAKLYNKNRITRENWSFLARKNLVKILLSKIPSLQPTLNKVLDLGCAGGEYAELIQKMKLNYTGIDAAKEMIKRAKKKYPNLSFSLADASQLPFKDHSFSIILSLGLVEYLSCIASNLTECSRVLDKKGVMILSVSTKYCFENWVKALLWLPRKFLSLIYYTFSEKRPYPIKHYMLSKRRLCQLLKKHGFYTISFAYYNPNPLCFPFSRIFPTLSAKISKRLESKAQSFPWRFFTTGILVLVQKTAYR